MMKTAREKINNGENSPDLATLLLKQKDSSGKAAFTGSSSKFSSNFKTLPFANSYAGSFRDRCCAIGTK